MRNVFLQKAEFILFNKKREKWLESVKTKRHSGFIVIRFCVKLKVIVIEMTILKKTKKILLPLLLLVKSAVSIQTYQTLILFLSCFSFFLINTMLFFRIHRGGFKTLF
jgi:hypothetical protein